MPPSVLSDLVRHATSFGPILIGTDLLQSRADALALLSMIHGDQVGKDPWVVRSDTKDTHARLVLCGLITGLARGNARLEQIRSEPVTSRVVGGVRLGMIPSYTGDDWHQVEELVFMRVINNSIEDLTYLRELGRYEELAIKAHSLRQNTLYGASSNNKGESRRLWRLEFANKWRAHLLGWVRFLEFVGLWQSGQLADAYTLAQTNEPIMYFLSLQKTAFIASVCTEIAVRLGRPTTELLKFGDICYEVRLRANELGDAVKCCENVCYFLQLRDQEDWNGDFARRLIELGTQLGDNTVVLSGFDHLVSNALRAEDPAMLGVVREELKAMAVKVVWDPELRPAFERLWKRSVGLRPLPRALSDQVGSAE
jgi:hypothetical protein